MNGGETRCAKVLRGLEKMIDGAYPGIWSELAKIRAAKGKKVDWPEHVFVPVSFCHDLVVYKGEERARMGKKKMFEETKYLNSISSTIFALNAWRQTKGIYRFDPPLADELSRTVVKGKLPSAVLKRSPEWSVCVDISFLQEKIPEYGGYVGVLMSVDELERPVFVLLSDGPDIINCLGFIVPESLQSFFSRIESGTGCNRRFVSACLSAFLYMCSANADIGDVGGGKKIPKRPEMLGKKRSERKTVAKGAVVPTEWAVGVCVGAALRRAFAAEDEAVRSGRETGTGPGTSKRPHIRTAHWHHYHTGPRDAEEKKLGLRWIPPVFVNLDKLAGEEMPATVRKVDGRSVRG